MQKESLRSGKVGPNYESREFRGLKPYLTTQKNRDIDKLLQFYQQKIVEKIATVTETEAVENLTDTLIHQSALRNTIFEPENGNN